MQYKKLLKKIGKVFYLILLGILLLIIFLYAGVRLFENQITQFAIQNIEKTLSVKVRFTNVDILPLKNFPNLTVRLENFGFQHSVDSFPRYDSLFQFKNVFVALKPIPLLKNRFDIQRIDLDGFNINYHIDEYGNSNFDFLMKTDTTTIDTTNEKSILNLILRHLSVENLNLQYRDKKNATEANIFIPSITINAKIIADSIDAFLRGSLQISQLKTGDISFSQLQPFKIDCNVGYQSGSVKIENFNLTANGLELETTGNLKLSDTTYINIKVDLKKLALDKVFNLMPDSIKKLYAIENISGNLGCITHISGYYYDTILAPAIQTNLFVKYVNIKMKDYPEMKNININAYASIPNYNNLNSMVAKIESFSCNIGKSNLTFSGQVSNILQPIYRANLNALVNLTDFKSFIPDSLIKDISGELYLNIATKGKLPNKIDSTFVDYLLKSTTIDFGLKDVKANFQSYGQFKDINIRLSYKPNLGLEIYNLSLTDEKHRIYVEPTMIKLKFLGSISDINRLAVQVDTLAVNTNILTLNSRLYASRLTSVPEFNVVGSVKLNLAEVSKILPDTLFEKLNGTLSLYIKSYGEIKLDSLTTSLMPVIFENSQFKLLCSNVNLSSKIDSIVKVEQFNSNIYYANDTLWINHLSGKLLNKVSFRIDSTSIWDIYSSIIKKEKNKKLIANTNVWIDKIDYALFVPFMATDTTEKKLETNNNDNTSISSPSYIIRGKLAVDQIIYNKINIERLSTKFRIADSLYILDDLYFKAFDGEMTTSVSYDIREKPFTTIEFKNQTQHINVKKLLADNDNFNQTNITDRQIDGLFSGNFYGRIVMGDSGVIYDRINLLGNFSIENGGIYNYEPAMQLAKFTNLNELDNIVFRKLESSVFIYNNQIYFPKTDIVSSAMDLSVYGMASFGTDYEYHIILYPGDILLGKSQQLLKKQGLTGEKFEGENKTDRSGIYLVSLKRGNESKNGFDTRQLQQLMKTTIRVQERGLNLVFHPKIFNFNTDIDRKEIKKKTKHENKTGE